MMASRSGSDPKARLRRVRLAGLIGALVAVIGLILLGGWPTRKLFDEWQQMAPRSLAGTRVHVVAIDDESLKAVGPWPWPRYHLARLTEEIGARGAAAIGFDIIFAERDALSPDIFAGMYSDTLSPADRARIGALPTWDSAFSTVIGNHPVVLARIGGKEGSDPAQLASEAIIRGALPPRAEIYRLAQANIADLDDAARGYGLINGPPDRDGVVRRVPLIARLGDAPAPALGLEVARVALGEEEIRLSKGSLEVGTRRVPMDAQGRVRLHFGEMPPSAVTSAVDLLRKGVPSDALAGKAVLIGLTATGTSDIVSTPIESESFGIYSQAQALDVLLRGEGWLARPAWFPVAESAVATLLTLFAILYLPRLRRAWFAVPVAAIALVGLSWLAFRQWALLVDPLPSLGLGLFAAGGVALGMYADARRERERLREALVEERVAAAATEAELAAARAIQLGMLPRRDALSSLDPRLDIDARLEPARSVGGDFYDVVRLSADRVAFTVADVTGKGVPASLFMAVSKALSKSVVLRTEGLGGVAAMLNEELSRDNADSGVTMLIGVIDLTTGEVAMVNAGHEDPIRLRADGTADEVKMEGGPPFCIVDYPWPVETVTLRPGETLVLLTDGVSEAQNHDRALYGRSRAVTALSGDAGQAATGIVDRLLRSVRNFEDGAEPSDDLTIVVLRYLA